MSAKFFLLERVGGSSFADISRIRLCKAIKKDVGDVIKVKLLKSGQILVEVRDDNQGRKLSNLTSLGPDVSLTVKRHTYLNTSRGVISSWELRSSDESEILEELTSQGVTEVKNIMSRKNGVLSKSNSYVLTFGFPVLPTQVKLCFQMHEVKPFIPKPRRCFKCFSFKHLSNLCEKEAICYRCGLKKHDGNCLQPVKCINCDGNHYSTSKFCQLYIEQLKIKEIQVTQNIPYYQAKKNVSVLTNKQSYANVVANATPAKTFRTIGTQTTGTDTNIFTQKYPIEPIVTVQNKPEISSSHRSPEKEPHSPPKTPIFTVLNENSNLNLREITNDQGKIAHTNVSPHKEDCNVQTEKKRKCKKKKTQN